MEYSVGSLTDENLDFLEEHTRYASLYHNDCASTTVNLKSGDVLKCSIRFGELSYSFNGSAIDRNDLITADQDEI